MTPKIKIGIISAVIAAVISGISIFYNKLVIIKGIDPLIFNIFKNGGVAIILSLLVFSPSRGKNLFNISFKTWKKLFLIGVIGGSIPFILFFEGLKTAPAINANLIQKSLFIWVAATSISILGEKLSFWQILGFLLVALSNFFIGGFTGFKLNQGELMILAATFFWTVEVLLAKITLKEVEASIVAWGRMFIGSLILIITAIVLGKLPLLWQIKSDQLVATFGSIILLAGYVTFWYKALKFAPANVVSSVLIISTPITNILSAFFITHTFPPVQFLNLAGTAAGVLLITFLLPKTKEKNASSRTYSLQ